MCRSRRELSNEYLLAKFGFDTAENCFHLSFRTPPVPSIFEDSPVYRRRRRRERALSSLPALRVQNSQVLPSALGDLGAEVRELNRELAALDPSLRGKRDRFVGELRMLLRFRADPGFRDQFEAMMVLFFF